MSASAGRGGDVVLTGGDGGGGACATPRGCYSLGAARKGLLRTILGEGGNGGGQAFGGEGQVIAPATAHQGGGAEEGKKSATEGTTRHHGTCGQ